MKKLNTIQSTFRNVSSTTHIYGFSLQKKVCSLNKKGVDNSPQNKTKTTNKQNPKITPSKIPGKEKPNKNLQTRTNKITEKILIPQ